MFRLVRSVFLVLVVIPQFLFSENKDSIRVFKSNGISQYVNSSGFEYKDSSLFVDNSLDGFQTYFARNNLGNVGLPISDLGYYPYQNNNKIGFNYWKNNYRNYFYTHENLKFYNTRSPYTDLFYVAGSKKEGYFKMTFSYNVKKNWNVTVDFSRIRSEGFYLNEKTIDNFVAVSTNYKSKNNRYWLLADVVFNSSKNQENGGITADSNFVDAGGKDRQLIGVNLTAAKRSVINKGVCVKQFLNFGDKSTDTASVDNIQPSGRFILTSSFDDEALMYEDDLPLSGFYKNIYFDTLKTHDSTYLFKLGNKLEWKLVDNGKHRGLKDMFGVSAGIEDELSKVKQLKMDTVFNAIILNASIFNTYSNNLFWWKIGGEYATNGYNTGDYDVIGVAKKKLMDSAVAIIFSVEVRENMPDFIYNRYSSNNFKWNNNYEKISEKRIGGNLEIKKIRFAIGADYRVFNNILYFDNYAISRQFRGEVPVFLAFVKQGFKVKYWQTNVKATYQFVPDSLVVRVPTIIVDATTAYENNFFKGALKLQIGVGVFYSSAYYANAYMPATGEFYLQNDKKYGNYPFIDVFLNAKIKSVRVFVKVDHLNSGWLGNNYMITPHYPMADRMFRLGISWRFWD